MDLSATAASAPTMPTPLDLASLLEPATDYWLLALVFAGCLASAVATRILACRVATRDLSPTSLPQTDAAATHRLLRWHEALILLMVGTMVTYLFGAGLLLFRAGEAALFTTAMAITMALTPLLVIALEALELPSAERTAERAAELIPDRLSMPDKPVLRRAA